LIAAADNGRVRLTLLFVGHKPTDELCGKKFALTE